MKIKKIIKYQRIFIFKEVMKRKRSPRRNPLKGVLFPM